MTGIRPPSANATSHKRLIDAPSYTLNHEEVQKALEEGITFIENLSPTEAIPDRYGHIEALKCKRPDGTEVTLPARAVMVAAGTARQSEPRMPRTHSPRAAGMRITRR